MDLEEYVDQNSYQYTQLSRFPYPARHDTLQDHISPSNISCWIDVTDTWQLPSSSTRWCDHEENDDQTCSLNGRRFQSFFPLDRYHSLTAHAARLVIKAEEPVEEVGTVTYARELTASETCTAGWLLKGNWDRWVRWQAVTTLRDGSGRKDLTEKQRHLI